MTTASDPSWWDSPAKDEAIAEHDRRVEEQQKAKEQKQ